MVLIILNEFSAILCSLPNQAVLIEMTFYVTIYLYEARKQIIITNIWQKTVFLCGVALVFYSFDTSQISISEVSIYISIGLLKAGDFTAGGHQTRDVVSESIYKNATAKKMLGQV